MISSVKSCLLFVFLVFQSPSALPRPRGGCLGLGLGLWASVAASAPLSPRLVPIFDCLGLCSSALAPVSTLKKCLDYITV